MEIKSKNIWKPHEDFVEDLLNLPEKYIWVDKLPQVGLTTSLGKMCLKQGKKFVEFAPTNKIIDDTLGKKIMDGRPYGKIGNNKEMCPYFSKYPFFDIYRSGNCLTCQDFYTLECGYRRIIDNDYPAYGLTYEKFRFLNMEGPVEYEKSKEFLNKMIIKKLFENTDVILLDEFARLIAFQPPGFFIDELSNAVEEVNKRIVLKDKIISTDKIAIKIFKEEIEELLKNLNRFNDGIKKQL